MEKCGEVCGVVGEGCGEERDDWLAMGGRTLVEGMTEEHVELEDLRRFLLRLPYLDRIGILFFFRDLFGFDVSSVGVLATFSCEEETKFVTKYTEIKIYYLKSTNNTCT